MIGILQSFDKIREALAIKKKTGAIDKFQITMNHRNEIAVVVVAEDELLRTDLIDDGDVLENVVYTFLSNDELQEDFFYSELFNTGGDCIIEYANSRRKLNNLLSPGTEHKTSIPIVTFYSYKGGMGRSTNLVISSTYLARAHGRKIIIIDCDFEAPGFSNFFLEENSSPIYSNGLIEYFFDKESQEEINLNDYSWEVSKQYSQSGEIRIIPAGNTDPKRRLENIEFPTHLTHYLEGLSRLDLSSTESIIKKFKSLISDIQQQYRPDAIFIDSRTGFTDIFGIAALQLSTQVVGFFSSSSQNDPGIYQFIQSISKLANSRTDVYAPILVNSFSDLGYFNDFRKKIEEIIASIGDPQDSFRLSPYFYHFRYDGLLSEIGTKRENKDEWLSQIDERQLLKGYIDVADKINESIGQITERIVDEQEEINEPVVEVEVSPDKESSKTDQEQILGNIYRKWPDLYADSEGLDYQTEFEQGRVFYRESMMDLFNFTKFIVLGNKGTGKSYMFQALKNEDITNELKRRAQKTTVKIEFLHLVDKKMNYFIGTSGLETFKRDIDEIGDFFNKFWKVYTWRSIIDKLNGVITFESSIPHFFSIKNNDTDNLKSLIRFIKDVENIIAVEKELALLDKELNSHQTDIVAIYDNLDLMVEPSKWKDEMASLISFWQFSSYKRIHSKLFLRSDLFKTIRGINNVQSLKNNIISIEWQKEEIFNYFFNLVKRYAKESFINVVRKFDFKRVSTDALEWITEFEKKFDNVKQTQFEEAILRKLCWVFFGQYPDRKAFGESYDWLYKNIMNADETISVRPFLDLLRLSIELFQSDYNKDSSVILPSKYYTAKSVRRDAVTRHFQDLVTEKGNESLQHIFDYIDNNEDYQFYQLTRVELYELLGKVIKKHELTESVEDLEKILDINGILRRHSNSSYNFAFLYKYRLGLKNRERKRLKNY
ncbi:KGGVGR-motif variant AAA ATPase [Chitinophaga filiformis]|uniref:CobQ/CobB/MinD/ParA nucleotide binding domain-containing protein n=1 Tax=Chitinophaga filiformis TaxID=104663 RepID=A0ABY4I2D5_CHIFI|nr:hypothetical protein [Chitinophaga filiformis]UPK69434.1 hypothetical protein MYF79_31210 [Chitinophaga filiformis]